MEVALVQLVDFQRTLPGDNQQISGDRDLDVAKPRRHSAFQSVIIIIALLQKGIILNTCRSCREIIAD